jgi:hypothetical protein
VFPISREPLESARDEFEKRQLRHVIEAEYMRSGRWPTGVREVAGSPDSPDALTSDDLDEYYYARRGNGIILLAPER